MILFSYRKVLKASKFMSVVRVYVSLLMCPKFALLEHIVI